MSKQRRLETQLFLAQEDVEASLILAAKNNRYAAFHCQQAAEKLIKALLDNRGIEFAHHRWDVFDPLDRADGSSRWCSSLPRASAQRQSPIERA
jgi:hypothetical protein